MGLIGSSLAKLVELNSCFASLSFNNKLFVVHLFIYKMCMPFVLIIKWIYS